MIAVISLDSYIRKEFSDALSNFGARVLTFESLDDLQKKHRKINFKGFVLELKTFIAASQEEKEFFVTLDNFFPLVKVLKNPISNKISGQIDSVDLEGDKVFEIFSKKCAQITPKGI